MADMKGLEVGLKAKRRKVEPKKDEKSASHEAPKRHGKVKHMHIHRADDGTYVIDHEHEPMADGTPVPNSQHTAPDMDALHDHLEDHLGEPNPGEAEADAGQSGIEGEEPISQGQGA